MSTDSDPGILRLRAALAALRREFPGEALYEARLEFRAGERHGETHGAARSWSETWWTVQVNNERASGEALEEVITEMRETRARRKRVPGFAERVAAILREIPAEGFQRDDVLRAAYELLARERRGR